jgi:hypothetical protein
MNVAPMHRAKLRTDRLVFALAVVLLANCRLVAQSNDAVDLPVATVHVVAFDPFGSKIRNSQLQIHLFAPDRQRDFAKAGESKNLTRIPYGTYKLSVWDIGGGIGERELVVNTKDVWARIGLAFPSGDRAWPPGDLTISGDIKPIPPTDGDWWVRIEGVYLNATREGPVFPSGKFSIGGLDMGTYLLEVFEGSALRHAETLDLDMKQPNTRLTVSIP